MNFPRTWWFISPFKAHGALPKRDGKDVRAGGWGGELWVLSSGHDMAVPLTNSQQLYLHEQDEASQNQQVWGRGPKDPACTERLLAIDGWWRDTPMPAVYCPGPISESTMGEQIGHHVIHNTSSKEDTELEDRTGSVRGGSVR